MGGDDFFFSVEGRKQAMWTRGERGERAVDGTGDSVERIRADHQADTLTAVSLDLLAKTGVRGIVVDLDNTVCEYRRPELAPGVAEWVAAARDRGFAMVLVSNNFTERVASVGAKLVGLRTILTKPLVERDFALTRVLRFLERTIARRT